jgi:hypothetical protein
MAYELAKHPAKLGNEAAAALSAFGDKVPVHFGAWYQVFRESLAQGVSKGALSRAFAVGMRSAYTDSSDGVARDSGAIAIWHARQWLEKHGKSFQAPEEREEHGKKVDSAKAVALANGLIKTAKFKTQEGFKSFYDRE